jgi:hypothetical protein
VRTILVTLVGVGAIVVPGSGGPNDGGNNDGWRRLRYLKIKINNVMGLSSKQKT